jgi:hypothetical protein
MVYRDPSKRYYSEAEAADYLGISKKMLARRRYGKKIDHIKDGHLILYELRDLDAYLGRFSTAPAPEPRPDTTAHDKWLSAFRSKRHKNRPYSPRNAKKLSQTQKAKNSDPKISLEQLIVPRPKNKG